jgi:hypothetical protein
MLNMVIQFHASQPAILNKMMKKCKQKIQCSARIESVGEVGYCYC